MDCGAYRAIPKLKMLWLDAFATPKYPGGVQTPKVDPGIASMASKCFSIVYYEKRRYDQIRNSVLICYMYVFE